MKLKLNLTCWWFHPKPPHLLHHDCVVALHKGGVQPHNVLVRQAAVQPHLALNLVSCVAPTLSGHCVSNINTTLPPGAKESGFTLPEYPKVATLQFCNVLRPGHQNMCTHLVR